MPQWWKNASVRWRGAGKYTRRVAIEQETQTVDAQGQVVRTWNEVAKRWAAIDPRDPEAQPADNVTHHVVRMRWDSKLALTSKHRIKLVDAWGATRILNIRSVTNEREADREWSLLCVEER